MACDKKMKDSGCKMCPNTAQRRPNAPKHSMPNKVNFPKGK